MVKIDRQAKKSDAHRPFNFFGIKANERLTVGGKTLIYKLPEEVAARLNQVTESYAKAQHVSDLIVENAREWEIKIRALTAWQARTEGLRQTISPHTPKAAGAPELMFDAIVDRYFQPQLSSKEERDPMALLARVLNGVIDTTTFAKRNFKYPASKTCEAQLWFLWVSIVFGILREANVPLRYKEAQRLLPHVVPLLERLQSHLPERLQKRKGAYSLRSAAVVAFRFSGACDLRIMREVFDYWTKGDVLFARVFTPNEKDADDIFMFASRFERYFLKATGRARRPSGMGSRQN